MVRPQEGRWLAGVAIGVAHRLGIPPWVARLLFFLAFASGGVGLFLYLAGWLLIPAEGEPESLGQRLARRVEGTQAWFGIGLVILAGAIILNMLPFVDAGLLVPTILLVLGILLYRNELPRRFSSSAANPPAEVDAGNALPPSGPLAVVATPPRPVRPPEPPSPLGRITLGLALLGNGGLLMADRLSPLVEANWRHYLAMTLAMFGVGLLVGSRYGRARWLIPIGILMVPFLIGATIWEYSDLGRDEYLTVDSFGMFPLALERDAGRVTVDLTQLDWEGETVQIDASMGAGELAFIIPETVGIDFSGEIGLGTYRGSFGGVGGIGRKQEFATEGTRGEVEIDAEVGLGVIAVLLNFQDQGLVFPEEGDLFLAITDEASLGERYHTPNGSIDLDLSRIELTEDRYLIIEAPIGPVTVVVPEGLSYRVRAYSDFGTINLFGEQLGQGGTARADSIEGGPVLELEIITTEGDITVVSEGGRS